MPSPQSRSKASRRRFRHKRPSRARHWRFSALSQCRPRSGLPGHRPDSILPARYDRMVSIAVWIRVKWLRGRHLITQPQAGHLKRLMSRALRKPSKKVLVNPCPHTWLRRQRGHTEGFCQENFFPRRLTSLRFTSTNSIIESLWWGLPGPGYRVVGFCENPTALLKKKRPLV
jgi:hypothetical protein